MQGCSWVQQYTMKHIIIILIIITSSTALFAQKSEGWIVNTTINRGDTIPFIRLREIVIMPPKVFKSKREARRYRRLARKIKKVLPYAKIAKRKLIEIETEVSKMNNQREIKKFINEKDKELKAEFEGQLREFTVSEGLLLIKLIDRETGDTSYSLIQDLKGNFTAFMWQSVARLFGSNLKAEYDPEGDDKLIEEIVLRIENGQL